MTRHRRTISLAVLGLLTLSRVALSAQGEESATEAPSAPAPSVEQTAPTPPPVEPSAPHLAPPEGTPSAPRAEPVSPEQAPAPIEDRTEAPAPVAEPAPPAPPPPPHIALLLPLGSKTYARAADAVKEGFLAAAQRAGTDAALPVTVYEVGDSAQSVFDAYLQAGQAGARAVVGPLTREAVTALAYSRLVNVPTLGLNVPEAGGELPQQFYSLSLAQEPEARQIARIAFATGKRRAVTVTADSPLYRRVQSAFAQEWQQLGATIVADQPVTADSKRLSEFRAMLRRENVEIVFLALGAADAGRVRPYIRPTIRVYATSQILSSKTALTNQELHGVQFVDMPWLLKPDHAAVMGYPVSKKAMNAELQRFYALGIDAFRLTQLLLTDASSAPALDGVTGRISLTSGHTFQRELMPGVFDDNGAVKLATP